MPEIKASNEEPNFLKKNYNRIQITDYQKLNIKLTITQILENQRVIPKEKKVFFLFFLSKKIMVPFLQLEPTFESLALLLHEQDLPSVLPWAFTKQFLHFLGKEYLPLFVI
ncbi:hypothetical protein AAG747_02735 [Rapidithrix thailandica]|uniref:Uncharacterized protein n=1 Tax=Rapidithrix thailandica TaxID=413964 RepID=A0AAW9S343_9BACT